MRLTSTLQHARYPYLILCILKIPGILVEAQEDCVRNCTKSSGINECVGSIPHDDSDWNALDTSVKSCYCSATTAFSQCSPTCSTDGFSPDLQGRLFGSWRYVNQICGDVVDQFKVTATSNNNTATSTATSTFTTIPVQLFHTESTATGTLDSVPAPTGSTFTTPTGDSSAGSSTHSSSSKARTIAISVSLANFGAVVIGVGLWLLFRNRRKRKEQNKRGSGDQQRAMIVIGPDGYPVDQSGPNLVSPMRGDFKSDTIKKWIQDQERMKQLGAKMESDTMTETLSVGYTLWSETDLCFTEMGAEDSRDMETIKEEPDGEDEIRSTSVYRTV